MKKLSYIGISIVVIFTAILCISCEKDDICTEGTLTTPLLVIEFFDAANTTEDVAKNVTNLKVQGIDALTEFQAAAATVNTVSIPLRTQNITTSYSFISGYEVDDMGVQTAGNEDIITFNHETQEIFLSRACGYITNYTLEDAPDVTVDTDNWINPTTGIIVAVQIVQNETETHVKIYH
ncbi:hypothetical protein IMCC3317_14770 [Kordia antarctica]|uniref:Uncharacterized protein n=1 Tax=Kordia antarctica TaxID=1218801 RepID=A0A7L4ZHD0_9FLAO|nr:DUF6452 family protein [Kordia antarctica]QHI36123.1 hypothetical protein IMCC3317_14770 [Kordia antarctica]